MSVPYYIVICGLSVCTILYFHLMPVPLYHIILLPVSWLSAAYYNVICVLSLYTMLYCHLRHDLLYHNIFSSVAGLSVCTILYCNLWPVCL